MKSDRVLHLEGVHNFRDYGGYAVSGGGRLRRGILWRSGEHFGATDSDLERIGALGLASIFDLRSSHERSVHPCRRPRDFSGEVFLSDDPPAREPAPQPTAPHVEAAQMTRRRDAASAREAMRRNYHKIALRPELIGLTRQMLTELSAGNGPALVNCMAGKDRTGITVAMVHLATGVHRDDIIADYLLTNTAGDVVARIAAGARSIRETAGEMDEDVLRVLMGVEAEYLESALSRIADDFGSTDAFLRDAVGLDDATRQRLCGALTEY